MEAIERRLRHKIYIEFIRCGLLQCRTSGNDLHPIEPPKGQLILHLPDQRDDRSDQATDPYRDRSFRLRHFHELLQRAILATINDMISIADEDHFKNVFSKIVNVPFQGRDHDRTLCAGHCYAGGVKYLHDLRHSTTRQHDLEEVELLDRAFGIQRGHSDLDTMDHYVLGISPTFVELPG